ncbi:molybdopterin molybdotransferase MoeA [Cyclobacterium qasimii]|uniref:Molybdopterin molybdenumtransferase n=2 Tax=Cyclobacterium qasimii TaxID=1350429 RepID=S7WVM6_9BACT|nr:molybdopterin molybdotransferase MoeA [Cyclobacterium qasimii]EPR68123.1 Molybdopterin biosynthesis protein MoeA [Cyclobacterium qasimii M12-11B]GEO19981.1 molybdopterin molybdenumtransferase MoeA [Cyclobacterium qasimii]
MKSVKEAQDTIIKFSKKGASESIAFEDCLNRMLAEGVFADRDAPPFDRVAMDGIAIQSEQLLKRQRFFIEDIQAAGQEQKKLKNPENCLEVMTGAVLPYNTDCVIPYERITIDNGIAALDSTAHKSFQNIHKKGVDAKKGDQLLPAGTWVHPGVKGVLATTGLTMVKVVKSPTIMICSTGDELVPIENKPLPHQIRRSNVYMLQAALKDLNIEAETTHLPDDKPKLKTAIKELLRDYDVLLFSGAVSKGKYDFLPVVFQELGVQIHIHGVKQKPGKPFLFGSQGEKFVFGFPGNPTSTLVCFHAYFKLWLKQHWGIKDILTFGHLDKDIVFNKPVTNHLLVMTSTEDGKLLAKPIANSGSGDWVHLALADAFLSLPSEQSEFKKGEIFPITYLHKNSF